MMTALWVEDFALNKNKINNYGRTFFVTSSEQCFLLTDL